MGNWSQNESYQLKSAQRQHYMPLPLDRHPTCLCLGDVKFSLFNEWAPFWGKFPTSKNSFKALFGLNIPYVHIKRQQKMLVGFLKLVCLHSWHGLVSRPLTTPKHAHILAPSLLSFPAASHASSLAPSPAAYHAPSLAPSPDPCPALSSMRCNFDTVQLPRSVTDLTPDTNLFY